ncbi:RnfH family protein [Moraxella oblonga]|uniref:RnfH family protein n=1 Tax=Moraxella oblonga TaxID=200413 RepID=UPI000834E136|nr:RnfH family protein [Moraxella oblonga]
MATITISLAYADVDTQHYAELQVPQGTSLYQAIEQSGWLDLPSLAQFSRWCADNMTTNPNHKAWYVGIYSQKKRLDTVLSDGDRVEIYRPLSYDPMTRRKSKSVVRLKKLGYRPL